MPERVTSPSEPGPAPNPPNDLCALSASEAARRIRDGELDSEALVRACLERTAQREPTLQAFAFLDPEHALAAARRADAERAAGRALGALHGVPVGVKDIFDTADMPTENGTVLHRGRQPTRDAFVVARLRAAGAIVLGKTVTTELAVFGPGKTTNPHDAGRTPGGSSSGSAAAVAAGLVPLALGSQTNGSTIRPAAFCGVIGFKPTHGTISRGGMLRLSRTLDHAGVFARSIEDVALLTRELVGDDPRDPDTRPRARPPFVDVAARDPAREPRFAFVATPHFARVSAGVRRAFERLSALLGERLEPAPLPAAAQDAWRVHQMIMEAEMAFNLAHEHEHGAEQLTPTLRAQLERGRGTSALDYQRALAAIAPMTEGFGALLSRYDALLTPATLGAAPRGLASTGDPVFCTPWTLCGMPALSLPLFSDDDGMPLGVQLVAARGDDARALQLGRWLMACVAGEPRRPRP